MLERLLAGLVILLCLQVVVVAQDGEAATRLKWQPLPDLPDDIGVAGPFVGVHNNALIVLGGANFPTPPGEDLWQVPKVWHSNAWVLERDGERFSWVSDVSFVMSDAVAYGACVSTPEGVVCIGGNDGVNTFAEVFLRRWNPQHKALSKQQLPPLPRPCAYGAAALVGDHVYVAGGQSGDALDTAMSNFWRLDVSKLADGAPVSLAWETLPPWPGPARAFNITVAQHNGFDTCVYVIGGRRQEPGVEGVGGVVAMADVYEFNPTRYDPTAFDAAGNTYSGSGEYARPWRRRADAPRPIMAGTAVAVGQAHVFVLSGADGSLMARADELKDAHPGFPKNAWSYHTITDTWIDAGPIPVNAVTTPAVHWDGDIILASGEVRPRVRTTQVWRISPVAVDRTFGPVNFTVLIVYLLAMVGVGAYFTRKNKDTNDYFRGGQKVAWWAVGCSIFATMLSSITYMAIPAKAFAQDWVYLLGNMMILAVAPIAVYLALPFFRRIDATSAYEYLQKRFNLPVRLFGSGLFTVFHVFRMGIVMSLAGLALATVTPLSPAQSVLLMGVLSIIYCTLGGVEAVIWTDTIQTVVLLGGALACIVLVVIGLDGGAGELTQAAAEYDKTHVFNFHWDATSANLALWVVVLGALGQNFSSYTSDQAVVQRYMTTPDEQRAARSIWTAALLAIPATFLFFGLGTALFAFYRAHPQRLDPTFTTDQILPLFIADELPIGLAGLVVAGIFAAAQSTISTSMNSTATAVVTDFLRPLGPARSERGYLNAGRVFTLIFGVTGTAIGLFFVDPDTRSRFDEFLMVIGLFMGALGGLFALGILTRRTHGWGALIGVACGAGLVIALALWTTVTGYLFAAIGIISCFVIGYVASLFIPARQQDLTGLTIHSLSSKPPGEGPVGGAL